MISPSPPSLPLSFGLLSFLTVLPFLSATIYFDISTCASTSISCIHVTPTGSDVTGNGTVIAPVRTIQRALDVAISQRIAANTDAIKIVLDDGTYPGGIVWKGSGISLTSRSGPSMTFIDGNMTDVGILIDSSQDETTMIAGVTIQHCKSTIGGAIAVLGTKTHPILRDMIIRNNTAMSGAGLLVNLAYPSIINITFRDNVARQGGAIGIVANTQLIQIHDCIITRNSAPSSFAGGMFLSLAQVQIIHSTISYNSAYMGGGIHCDSSILQFYHSLIMGNSAEFDDGGGLYGIRSIVEMYDSTCRANLGSSKGACLKVYLGHKLNRDWNKFPYDFRAARSVFEQNIGDSDGIVSVKDFVSVYMEDCIFIENETGETGILYVGTGSQAILNRCTFTNGKSEGGGGLYVLKGATVTCTNCTFIGNAVSTHGGGAIVVSKGKLTLINPIFQSNTAEETGGALACMEGSCQITGGKFDSNVAATEGGAIAVTGTSSTITGTIFQYNNATNGAAIRIGLKATSTITGSTFHDNRALSGSGTLYWTTPETATAAATLSQNTFIAGSSNYGNEFASAPTALVFVPQGANIPSTQRSDPSFSNNRTILITQTISNVASIPLRLAILDAYGQRVDMPEMSSIDVYATITPYVTNSNNNTTTSIQPAIFVNLDRIHMPNGLASFPLAIAGELGASYAIDFTTSIASVSGVRLIVTIQHCQERDYITYYPPGTSTYRVCNPATPAYISNATFAAIIVICITCMLMIVIVQLMTFWFWNTPVIRGSTPSFLSLLLLGALIGYVSIILANIDVDRTSQGMSLFTQLCRAQYWLLGLSFVLMFGTLALKTWRIRQIFCNKQLTDLGDRVATKYLYIKLAILLAIEMSINIAFNAADPLQGKWKIHDTTYSAVCDSKSDLAYMIVMLASKGLIALVCVLLAYDTRNVTSAFNESKQLMIASYNMFVSVIVVASLSTTLPDPQAAKAAFSFGSLFVITSTWMILFFPKLYVCFFASERNQSNQTMMTQQTSAVGGTKGSSHERTSNGMATKHTNNTGHGRNKSQNTSQGPSGAGLVAGAGQGAGSGSSSPPTTAGGLGSIRLSTSHIQPNASPPTKALRSSVSLLPVASPSSMTTAPVALDRHGSKSGVELADIEPAVAVLASTRI